MEEVLVVLIMVLVGVVVVLAAVVGEHFTDTRLIRQLVEAELVVSQGEGLVVTTTLVEEVEGIGETMRIGLGTCQTD